MRKVFFAMALSLPIMLMSQWKTSNLGPSEVKEGKELIDYAGIYTFDLQTFNQKLTNAPDRMSGMSGKLITIPNVDGQVERFEVWEASVFSSELQEKYPEIRSYVGVGLDDPHAYLRFSVSPYNGISTMVFRAGTTEFIEPYTTDNSKYIVFNSKEHRAKGKLTFECTTPEDAEFMAGIEEMDMASKSSAGVFKTFRLALATTGEYTQAVGGTVAAGMAAINTTMTRINGIFEKDFAVNLILIPNNDVLIFTNPSTDPFTNPNSETPTQNQLQSYLDANIGNSNYDIGHVFHRHTGGSGGGNAGCIGCICSSGKGRGWTSLYTVQGDSFDVDFAAHEFGHQIGANHTFSWNWEGTGVNVEPGSGSTIMGYAGVTNYNVQNYSDDYFAYRSVFQVQVNLENKSCADNTDIIGNSAPIVDAGETVDIPSGTAFRLEGTATDPDGDALVYNWEQMDSGSSGTTGSNSRVSFTKAIGPNFRSLPHKTEPVRYFPDFDWIREREVEKLENYWRAKWEAVTTVPRTFNFSFTARDNNPAGPQTNTDTRMVRVRNAGPFVITSPERFDEVSLNSGTMTVEWDVAGTDQSPINTSHVRILFSDDDGLTFTVVAANVPNNGSATFSFPQGTVEGDDARVMIEAVDNIYFVLSRDFKLRGIMSTSDLQKFEVGIYPNPSNGTFYVNSGNVSKGDVKTVIFNSAGQMVYNNKANHKGGALNQTHNVKLPSGVYMVTIETENGRTSEKLIIK